MRFPTERITRLAERQWGHITRAQLLRVGVSRSQVDRLLVKGWLVLVYPGVYALGHRSAAPEAPLAAALLYAGPGAALSHPSSLRWWGLLRHDPQLIHLSAPGYRSSVQGIAIHHPKNLERVWHRGLPVTPIPRALLDSAPLLAMDELRIALAEAEFGRLLRLHEVNAVLGRGQRGSAALKAALSRHLPQLARTRSKLEDDFLFLCERFNIPIPEVNVRIAGWEVDALWRELNVAAELDGVGAHGFQVAVARDRRKELALRGAGLVVLRYSADQVYRHPAAVANDALATLGAAVESAA